MSNDLTEVLAAMQLRASNVQECPQDAPDALWRSVHSRSAQDVPPLLAAVKAVLAKHAPTGWVWRVERCGIHYATNAGMNTCSACRVIEYAACETCRDGDGQPERAENCHVRALIGPALLGEGNAGA